MSGTEGRASCGGRVAWPAEAGRRLRRDRRVRHRSAGRRGVRHGARRPSGGVRAALDLRHQARCAPVAAGFAAFRDRGPPPPRSPRSRSPRRSFSPRAPRSPTPQTCPPTTSPGTCAPAWRAGGWRPATAGCRRRRYLTVGLPLTEPTRLVFVFHSQRRLLDGLADLRMLLLAGWLAVVAAECADRQRRRPPQARRARRGARAARAPSRPMSPTSCRPRWARW